MRHLRQAGKELAREPDKVLELASALLQTLNELEVAGAIRNLSRTQKRLALMLAARGLANEEDLSRLEFSQESHLAWTFGQRVEILTGTERKD